jgi:uncharacterized protein (UPF0303 family)
MSLEADIDGIQKQEQALVFPHFSEDEAWALGSLMRIAAVQKTLALVIDIRTSNKPLFYTALPGTTPENPDWVRRKANTVARFEKSSYLLGLEYQKSGKAFDRSRGIDPVDYANAGGGFPIRVSGIGVAGAVIVSGAPQRVDHEFVVECLCAFLSKDYERLKLSPDAG